MGLRNEQISEKERYEDLAIGLRKKVSEAENMINNLQQKLDYKEKSVQELTDEIDRLKTLNHEKDVAIEKMKSDKWTISYFEKKDYDGQFKDYRIELNR